MNAYAKHKLHQLPSLVDDLYDAQGGMCFHCLRHMEPWPWTKRHLNGFTRDHIIPKSAGTSTLRNIVLAHQWCNEKRGNRPLSLFDRRRARLIIAAIVAKRGGW